MVVREDILNILHVRKHYFDVTRRIVSYFPKKISVWGFFQLVPRRKSRKTNKQAQISYESIPKLVKQFIENNPR